MIANALINSVPTGSNSERRKYNNALRDQHSQLTRDAILDAVEGMLSDTAGSELSFARLAERAGVSEATVYRHFPSKPELLDAFARRAARRFDLTPDLADDLAAVPARVADLFAYFRENRALLLAAQKAPDMAEYARAVRKDRGARVLALVVKRYPSLPPDQQRSAAAVLHMTLSATHWLWLVDACGLTDADAVAAARWALASLVADLDRKSALCGTSPQPKE